MRQALLVLALGVLLAGCGGSSGSGEPAEAIAPPPTVEAALLHRYGYDATAPLDVQEVKSEDRENVTVHDITYAGPDGRIDAYLVVPEGDGPFPAIEFMPGAPGSRLTFLSTALELANRGVVSLLPDPPYARPPIKDVVEFKPTDVRGIEQEVKEIRRGIDLLLSRKEVDPTRLAYVGFSWGGSVGAIASAVERRIHSFLLMSLVPRLSTDMRGLAEERGATGDLDAYEQAMQPVDAVNYLPHAAPSALFLQFGNEDTRPSPADGKEAFAVASSPKKAEWYEGGHELDDRAETDAANWIAARLGLA